MTSRLHRLIVAVALLSALGSGCSSSHGPAATSGSAAPLPPVGNTTATLKATAVAWAHAFLVGSLDDIKALQSSDCADRSGTTLPIRTVNQYLSGERAVLKEYVGRPLDTIAIRGVVVRNVTSTTGEALVEYDLPTPLAGNDSWVSYVVHDGRWNVSQPCRAPIGGSSSSASGTVSSPTP